MSDLPAPGSPAPPRLAARLALARAALWWERAWPAAWPAVAVLGSFAVAALFDLLPLLPGDVHAAILALFAFALAGAAAWGWRTAGSRPEPGAARRRIEQASGLPHRPLQALDDRPSAPLDGAGRALWAAHHRRMAAAVRRLRVGWPASGLARRDPWGLRSVLAILLILGTIDAGADWRARVVRAFTPGLSAGAAAAAASFDLWLTPPDYTGLAPRFLRAGDSAVVPVPAGSALLAQVHGGSGLPRLAIDGNSRDFTAVDKANFSLAAALTSGRQLTLSQDGSVLGRWTIAVIPDKPPTIAFVRMPAATPRAALRLDYRAGDDYGVEGVKAVIRRTDGSTGKAAGDALTLQLPLPGLHLKTAEATSYHDLSAHPWAGLPVEIRLVATDALGQKAETEPVRMALPERVFHNPVARAIVDQRKELAKDPASAGAVAEILGDLNRRPALYRDDVVVYLALRMAQQQLKAGHDKGLIAAVEQLLWDTALRIEDGRLSLAERDLHRAQQQLRDALAAGAPDAKIDQLMQQLQQALDRYLQQLAQQLQRDPTAAQGPFDPSRVITSRDLQQMLEHARELMRSGSRDAAREVLSQLQNMLENLRTARPSPAQQEAARRAQKTMRGLQELMQRQRDLLDRSFRAQTRQEQQERVGQPGQPGEEAQQGGGDQARQQGDSGEMNDAAGQQEAVRHGLGDIMRQLGVGPGDIPTPFGRAERAMHDAAGALRRDRPGEAIAPQTEALDQLQQAARDFAREMERRLPNGWGGSEVGATDRDPRGLGQRDPFGRPISNNGTYDQGDVKIPDDNILQKSRQILDELRRRAGERDRPAVELDYIDRLLKRF